MAEDASDDLLLLAIDHEVEPRKRSRRYGWMCAFGLVLIGASVLAANLLARKESAIEVPVGTKSELLPPSALDAGGYLVAQERAEVRPRVSGVIASLSIVEGSLVRAGDRIAELQNDDLRALVAEAEATLRLAKAERARLASLQEVDVVGEAELDRAKAAEEVATARRSLARANLAKTHITSPIDGVVTLKSAHVGEMADPSSAIAVVVNRSSLLAEVEVNEPQIHRLRPGMPAEVEVEAAPGKKYRGRLVLIVPSSNRQKGVVRAKIEILDPDERLIPELSVRAKLLQEAGSEP